MTEAEIEALKEEIQDLRETVREDLTGDFGGEPESYRTDTPVPDGGDS